VIELDIPSFGVVRLAHAVVDVNGTLALDGVPEAGVDTLLAEVSAHVDVHLLSALSHGNAEQLEAGLGHPITRLRPGGEAEQKAEVVHKLGASACVAIGNGRNDAGMLRIARLAIAVLGPEGMATATLEAADVVVRSGSDALQLLLHPTRLRATLRS
jgi:soluble P-type ATPase